MDVLLKKYFWVINLVVLGTCAGLAGRAAAHFIEGAYLTGDDTRPSMRRPPPLSPTKQHAKEGEEVAKRNIFCSACAPPPPPTTPDGGTGTSTEVLKSSLQLELVCTMISFSDDDWSMAVIRDLSSKEKDSAMFNRGKAVFSTGASVYKVVSRRVYLMNSGRIEYLELDGDKPPAAPAVASIAPASTSAIDPNMGDIDKGVSCSGNSCTVERALVEKVLSNTTMIATAARIVPSIKDGKPNGFKLYAIRPNSLLGKIGLQNGDLVKAINGAEMTTPDAALSLYIKLRSASHVSVQAERRGENVTLDYTIK
jgi:general secretion pathway protein C